MTASIAKWGNSLAVRIPRALAERARIAAGMPAELREEDGRIAIAPVKPRLKLGDLLSGITPEAMREAFARGPDAGRERIE